MSPESKIAKWIQRQVVRYGNGVLKLRYLGVDTRQTKKTRLLDEWPLDANTVHEVAQQVWSTAAHDATSFNETPRYELVIGIRKDGKTKIKASYGFLVDTREDDDNRSIMGEATVGFMRQVFSHNEVIMKTLVAVVAAGEDSKLREIERLSRRNGTLEDLLDRTREEVERSKDKNHERALEKAKFEADEKRINEIVSTGRTMVPFLVNSIAKKNLLPTEGSSPLLAALNPIMETMTPDQFSKMQEILTPAQQVGLAELYKLAKGEEEDAKRRRKKNEAHR